MYLKIIVSIILLLCTFTSCDKVAPPEELMKRPQTDSEYKELIDSLYEKNRTLTIPIDGEIKSIYRGNLIGSDEEELVVLSKHKDISKDYDTYYVVEIYRESSSDFTQLVKIPLNSEYHRDIDSINRVDVQDITGDNKMDVVISLNLNNSKIKEVLILSYDNGVFRTHFEKNVLHYDLYDISSDGVKDILTVKKENDLLSFNVNSYIDNSPESLYVRRIYDRMVEPRLYPSVFVKDRRGVMIYDDRSDSSGRSLLFYGRKGEYDLKESGLNLKYVYNRNYNRDMIGFSDVNSDSITEIGALSDEMGEFEKKEFTITDIKYSFHPVTYWRNVSDWDVKVVKKEYINDDFGFKVNLDKYMGDRIGVIESAGFKESVYREFSFYRYNEDNSKEFIMTIFVHIDSINTQNSKVIFIGDRGVFSISALLNSKLDEKAEDLIELEETKDE